MQRRRSGAVPAFLQNCSFVIVIGIVMLFGVGLSGCVSSGAHEQTLAELEKARKAAVEQAEADSRRLAALENQIGLLTTEIRDRHVEIQEIRDRLTINLVDRILFVSGSATLKPDGLRLLEQVSTLLKSVTDKQIRVDGHTDNMPIGAGLKNRFSSNWELSSARAITVARYLISEGGIAPELLTAAGHADTQPVADNDTADGRSQNRRIEIVLYVKDLGDVMKADAGR